MSDDTRVSRIQSEVQRVLEQVLWVPPAQEELRQWVAKFYDVDPSMIAAVGYTDTQITAVLRVPIEHIEIEFTTPDKQETQ